MQVSATFAAAALAAAALALAAAALAFAAAALAFAAAALATATALAATSQLQHVRLRGCARVRLCDALAIQPVDVPTR